MGTQTNKLEALQSRQIYTTFDYSVFKSIGGNRNLNEIHIQRLKKSMQKEYLFTVIVVNEKFEIIDGNHRFNIIKELGLPINYTICYGYGLNEVHILNQNSKTWTADDYMEGYANLGKSDYVTYKKFKEKHGYSHNVCQALLGKNTNYGSEVNFDFKSGNYKVNSLFDAEKNVGYINLFKDIYSGYKRRSFIHAILRLLTNPEFDIMELVHKAKIQPNSIKDCVTTSKYIELLEEIYNYKRRNKVNLKYS
jgi:disulfide oxidoreductase YuzD